VSEIERNKTSKLAGLSSPHRNAKSLPALAPLPCSLALSLSFRKSHISYLKTKPVDALQVQAPAVDPELGEAALEEGHRRPLCSSFFVEFFFLRKSAFL
jgi:hypothetical protein